MRKLVTLCKYTIKCNILSIYTYIYFLNQAYKEKKELKK